MQRRLFTLLAAAVIGGSLAVAGCDSGGNSDTTGPAKADVPETATAPRNTAVAEPQPEPAVAVVAERLPYAEVGEQLVYGHFVFPADMVDPLPAILMIHDSNGLSDHIRAMAEQLAGEGYIVLAVDLFGGTAMESTGAARQKMIEVIENPELANENIRQAYAFVSETAGAPRVGALGWDFGGNWSLRTALLFPQELDAVVIVYGQLVDDAEALRRLDVPILGLFGGKDRDVAPDSVKSFERALDDAGKKFEIHVYPEAAHSFADPSAASYRPVAAADSWQRMLDFFDRHLRAGNGASP